MTLDKYDNESIRRDRDNGLEDEVRRLFFVASTRAKEDLYVSSEYVAFNNLRTGRVYNQFLRLAYENIGQEFHVNESEFLFRAQRKKILADMEKAKSKGITFEDYIDSKGKLTKKTERLMLELNAEYTAANPGKDFCTEYKIPTLKALDDKDLEFFVNLWREENIKNGIKVEIPEPPKRKSPEKAKATPAEDEKALAPKKRGRKPKAKTAEEPEEQALTKTESSISLTDSPSEGASEPKSVDEENTPIQKAEEKKPVQDFNGFDEFQF